MRLDALFFDLYGTLLVYGDMTSGWSAWLTALLGWLEELGLEIDRKRLGEDCEGFFSRPAPVLIPEGLTVYESRLLEFATGHDLDPSPDHLRRCATDTIGAWQEFVDVDTDALPILARLSESYPLALISNFDHPPHVRQILEESGLARYFQSVVVSGDLGIKKPDPAIFAPALAAVGLSPERIAYVGDAPEDILAAQRAGMLPIRLQRDGDTESDKAADFRHTRVPRQWTEGIDHPTISSLRDLPALLA